MAISEQQYERAKADGEALRQQGHAVAARYDRRAERLVVSLHNGVELAVPVRLIEGLADATPHDLGNVEVTPSGLGLYWSVLDADVYIPALLNGVFGSRSWMASMLGSKGGKANTSAKVAAARSNGRKGGRPRKQSVSQ